MNDRLSLVISGPLVHWKNSDELAEIHKGLFCAKLSKLNFC